MDRLVDILQLPSRCLVNNKITKAFFKRNFDLSPSDKRLLDDFSLVRGMDWIASINPASSNINRYEDDSYVFEEVQVISLNTSPKGLDKHLEKLSGLIQRYIPYQVLLCIDDDNSFVINAADKRINLAIKSNLVVEKQFNSNRIILSDLTTHQKAFIESLAFAKLEKFNLKVLYESYIQRIINIQTASVVGFYSLPKPAEARKNHRHLQRIAALQEEIVLLQNRIKKESQLNTQLETNIKIQQLRKETKEIESLLIT